METVTQRPRPRRSGNESAAIALTAQLLAGLKTGTAVAVRLTPSADRLRYYSFEGALGGTSRGSGFGRQHGSQHGTTWFGYEKQLDQHGREWRRDYDAVIDDFGNLVEVPA